MFSTTKTQFTPQPESNEMAWASFDAAFRIAPVIAGCSQRLFRVQSDAATAAFVENSEHLKALLSTKDPAAALTRLADLYQANLSRLIEVTRTYFAIVPEIHADLAKVMGECFASYSDAAHDGVEKFKKAVHLGDDETALGVKDFFPRGIGSGSRAKK